MEKFDIYRFLYEAVGREQDEVQNQDPNSASPQDPNLANKNPQASSPGLPENPAAQVKGQAGQSKGAFRDIIGGTVSDISYEPVGSGGGKITIKVSNSHIPLVVSWVGQKVSVQQPNGNVILLSSGDQ